MTTSNCRSHLHVYPWRFCFRHDPLQCRSVRTTIPQHCAIKTTTKKQNSVSLSPQKWAHLIAADLVSSASCHMTGAMATAVRNRGEALTPHGIPFSWSAKFQSGPKIWMWKQNSEPVTSKLDCSPSFNSEPVSQPGGCKKQSYCNHFVLVTARLGGPERMLQRNGWILFFGRFASPWSVWPRHAAGSARAPRCLSLSDWSGRCPWKVSEHFGTSDTNLKAEMVGERQWKQARKRRERKLSKSLTHCGCLCKHL